MKDEIQKWVGLNEVRQKPEIEVLGVNRGAHVTAIALCKSREDYSNVVKGALDELGLELVESEEVETCQERMNGTEMDENFIEALNQVEPMQPVAFLHFHTFPLDK